MNYSINPKLNAVMKSIELQLLSKDERKQERSSKHCCGNTEELFQGDDLILWYLRKRLFVYKKHSASTSVAETAAKYNCRIVNLPCFLGQKGRFSVANCG